MLLNKNYDSLWTSIPYTVLDLISHDLISLEKLNGIQVIEPKLEMCCLITETPPENMVNGSALVRI